MIFSLGDLSFEFNKNAPQGLSSSMNGEWQQTTRISGANKLFKQSGRIGSEELNLDCNLIMQSSSTLNKLKEMLKSEKSYELIDGEGNIYGSYVITKLDYSLSKFIQTGLPRIQKIIRASQISEAEALKLAEARLNQSSSAKYEGSFSMLGRALFAGSHFELKDKLEGQIFRITELTHELNNNWLINANFIAA